MSNVRTIRRGGDIFRLTEQPGGRVLVELRSVNPGVVLSGLSVPAGELRHAVDEVAPAGSYTRTESPDYADGGVTAAAIEKEAEQPRTLTADDITDEMIQRGMNARSNGGAWPRQLVLNILTAALTEPQRPEGAEEIECALLDADEAVLLASDQERIERLADFLAERGVRVITEEGP